MVRSGEKTGRSPNDKRVVEHPDSTEPTPPSSLSEPAPVMFMNPESTGGAHHHRRRGKKGRGVGVAALLMIGVPALLIDLLTDVDTDVGAGGVTDLFLSKDEPVMSLESV